MWSERSLEAKGWLWSPRTNSEDPLYCWKRKIPLALSLDTRWSEIFPLHHLFTISHGAGNGQLACVSLYSGSCCPVGLTTTETLDSSRLEDQNNDLNLLTDYWFSVGSAASLPSPFYQDTNHHFLKFVCCHFSDQIYCMLWFEQML